MNNLPYGSGLSVCNSRNIQFLNEIGFEPLDGGAGKCKQLDSYFYDNLVSLGYRGRELRQNIEADWIVSSTKKCKNLPNKYGGESLLEAVNNNNLIFSYINTNANGSAFFSMNDFFKVIGALFIDSLMVSTSLLEALLLIINFSFMLNWLFDFLRFLFS